MGDWFIWWGRRWPETRPPYEYFCIPRPQWDLENENDDRDEDEQLDEEELEELTETLRETHIKILHKPAAEQPDYKWIAMEKTWQLFLEWDRRQSYTNPDNFEMYIYNDFYGYGLQEMIENILVKFNKEVIKKNKDETALKQMWATISAFIHWLLFETPEIGGSWFGLDDGERVEKTANLIGRAFLEALNELDLAGKLKPDSEFKDLALIMSMFLQWGADLEGADLEENNDLIWQKEVLAYSKKAGIDLESSGCHGMRKLLETYGERFDEIEALEGAAKSNKWEWKQYFKDFHDEYAIRGSLGGEQYNIMLFSRQKRAKHAFDKKDPLAGFSEKDLKSGKLAIGWKVFLNNLDL